MKKNRQNRNLTKR